MIARTALYFWVQLKGGKKKGNSSKAFCTFVSLSLKSICDALLPHPFHSIPEAITLSLDWIRWEIEFVIEFVGIKFAYLHKTYISSVSLSLFSFSSCHVANHSFVITCSTDVLWHSILIQNCCNCRIICACMQLRCRDCNDLVFSLFSSTNPSIESSINLEFACLTLFYKQLEGQTS